MSLVDRRIAVVGATGAVGLEMLALLASMGVKPGLVTALASARSAGSMLPYGGGVVPVLDLDGFTPESVEIGLFAASSDVAKAWAPRFNHAGAAVVDNSSAFRMTEGVPLVIPEVNGELLSAGPKLVANPNCSTIILLMAATPLRRAFGCERLIVSTYQAASGAGIAAMEELRDQARRVLDGGPAEPKVFAEPCAFNVFSHNSEVELDTGLNVEERKVIEETRKIWGDAAVAVSPTCIRVPTMRAHAESVHVTLKAAATEAEVRAALAAFPGVEVLDDRAGNRFPTPLKASARHEVLVGRIRPDPSRVRGDGRSDAWQLFVVGDQLLKGAALNAVQIAERLA